MPKGELPSETTVEADISKVELELCEEAKELAFVREFVSNNIYKEESKEDSEIVELSEEEREGLFFAPGIELTKSAVEERKKNIEESQYEIVKLEEPSAENNLLIKQENISSQLREEYSKRKEPKNLFERYNLAVYKHKRVKNLGEKLYGNKEKAKQLEEELWENYPELVHSGDTGIGAVANIYGGLKRELKEEGKSEEEITDVTLKACSRLLPFYEEGVIDEISIYYKDSNREAIRDIAEASEEKWQDLLTNLKEIPHFNIRAKDNVDTIGRILNNGLDGDVVEYLETLSREGILVQKTGYMSEKSRERLVTNIFEGNLNKEKETQNSRRARYYGSAEPLVLYNGPRNLRDENSVFHLNALRYGVDINKIYSSTVESYHKFLDEDLENYQKAKPEERSKLAQVLDQKFKIVAELEKAEVESGGDVESILNFIQQEENREIIKKADLYQRKLGMQSSWFHRNGAPSRNTIEIYLSEVEESLLRASERIDSGLNISDENSLKELLAAGDEDTFATMRALKYMDYYFPKDKGISREEFNQMVVVEEGEYHFSEKALEYLYSSSQLNLRQTLKGQYGYPNFLKGDTIENFKDPNAKKFWSMVGGMKGYSDIAFKGIQVLKGINYDYESFLGRYVNEVDGENFLNETFYKELIQEEIEEREKDPYIRNIRRDISVPIRLEDRSNFNVLDEETLILFYRYGGDFIPERVEDVISDQFISNLKTEPARAFWTYFRGVGDHEVRSNMIAILEQKGEQEDKYQIVTEFFQEMEERFSGHEEALKSCMDNVAKGNISMEIALAFPQHAQSLMAGRHYPNVREFLFQNGNLLMKDEADVQFMNSMERKFGRGLVEEHFLLLLKGYKKSIKEGLISTKEKELFYNFFDKVLVLSPVYTTDLFESYLNAREANMEVEYLAYLKELRDNIYLSDGDCNEGILLFFSKEATDFLLKKEYKKSPIEENYFDNLKTSEYQEFWSFTKNLESPLSSLSLESLKKISSYKEGPLYQDFLSSYTVLKGESPVTERLLKEEFIFSMYEDSEKDFYENMVEIVQSGSLEKFDLETFRKELWVKYIEVKDEIVRDSFLAFYKSRGEDFTERDIEVFFKLIGRIENSPSKEVNRLKNQIMAQLSSSIEGGIDVVLEQYEILENLFVRNNSPVSVLRYKVFDKLFSDGLLNYSGNHSVISKIFSETLSDVTLEQSEKRERVMGLVRKDLLKVAKDSADENFYNFMVSLRDGIAAIDFYDKYTQQGFSDEELIDVIGEEGREFMMKSLDIFFTTSNFVSKSEEISGRIEELREFLGITRSEQLADGIYSFYLEPLNVPKKPDLSESIGLLMRDIENKKEEAHSRGLQYYKEGLSVKRGDLVKGIKSEVLSPILDSGVLSKDFLGASASQDVTPYDTDTQMIIDVETNKRVVDILNNNAALGYGDVFLVFRDRGQFVDTVNFEANEVDPDKYELIHSKAISEKHYGIRTGIGSTEIDFIYYTGDPGRTLRDIKFDIARMGVYIPVLDSNNNIIFTPEDFEKERATFRGLGGLKGENFRVNVENDINEIRESIDAISTRLEESQNKIVSLNEEIESRIKTTFQSRGFTFETSRTGLEGLRVENVGSTSRLTHVPGVSDFDFSVLMDRQQLKKLKEGSSREVIQNIMESIGEVKSGGKIFETPDGGIQLVGSEILLKDTGETIDFDLGITDKKDNLDQSNTHNKIVERLGNIKANSGGEAYNFVISNIVLAKKFLKKYGCYKKGAKEGGFGGVGVENWILQHKGSFEEAALSFLEASTTESGDQKDFSQFQRDYTVWDSGRDIRTNKFDEFVSQNMTAEGYNKMRSAILELKSGKLDISDV
jgi:hypothetical protein